MSETPPSAADGLAETAAAAPEPKSATEIATDAATVRVLHLSDIHCGSPFVLPHVDAAETLAAAMSFSAIVVSGDFSQRARESEFAQARDILTRLRAIAPTLCVPGNHDTAWWHAPFGFGDFGKLHERYREYIDQNIEPTLRLPGVSIVGLNSAAGTFPQALTWYPRDWRVKGGLTPEQLELARERLAASPPDDLRLLVVHHNIVRGQLSKRWGMKNPHVVLDRIAAAQPHVVCTGHDHQERIEVVERRGARFLVSGANTLSSRVRGGRASALNVIEANANWVKASAWTFENGAFTAGPMCASLARR